MGVMDGLVSLSKAMGKVDEAGENEKVISGSVVRGRMNDGKASVASPFSAWK